MWADFVLAPVPDVIEQSPGNVLITFNYKSLSPEISAGKSRKLSQVRKGLVEVGYDGCQIFWVTIQSLDDLVSPVDPVEQIPKKNTVAAELWKFCDQPFNAERRADELNIIDEPAD